MQTVEAEPGAPVEVRLEGVEDERARDEERTGEHDEHAGGDPDERAGSHRTLSVNGAVSTFPPTLNCRNKRHVPDWGSKTPTFSFPGDDECPLIRVLPKMPAQAGVFAPHTCVWKYDN